VWLGSALLVGTVAAGAALMSARDPSRPESAQSGRRQSTVTVTRRDFVRSVRLTGTVEAVQATTVSTPRMAGQTVPSLVITRLIRAGTIVKVGDLLVEFDRQDQLKNALDRRVELSDLEQQIKKKEAEEVAARTRDETEIKQAESTLTRAELDVSTNDLIEKIKAEKNLQNLAESRAKLQQLRLTFDLKRKAAQADLGILQIRRDRAENAMRQAETNASKMAVVSPIAGMAVLRSIWKGGNLAEVQEGEEVRSGMPIVDVVNPSMMRVRARVNQADINELQTGQPVRIGLDAYPDLFFDGTIGQISPLAVRSALSAKVRTFVVLIDIRGSHPKLMPDLTASLDVELAREPGAIVVPRDAIRVDGERTFVRVRRGSSFQDHAVKVGSRNAHEAVVTNLEEGAVVARNVDNPGEAGQ
jgi:multidrug efflux pump subunit AcrA (membrane-fusion protein)